MPHPNQSVAVRHPDSIAFVVLDPAVDYAPDDVLVRTYPQFFTKRDDAGKIVESVSVEAATAAPGEKRSRSRSK
jgi:hypothetical protein